MHTRNFIPRLLFIPLILLMSCLTSTADELPDPLDKQISGGWTYNSFNEAIQQIEQNTGFKVSCPSELKAFMQTIWMKGRFYKPQANTTVKKFLDQMGELFDLGWDYDAVTNVVTLKLLWKTADPRNPAELLKAVWQPGYWTDYEKDTKWQTAFNALLSIDVNFEKAWKVRQKSSLQGMVRFADSPSKPVLRNEVTDSLGDKYVLIIICQPISMTPGSGSISYYLFKKDGILVSADLIDSGWRCFFVDDAIDDEYGTSSDKASELQMILKFNNNNFMIARFVLDANHLKITHLTDTHGKETNNDGIHVGQSLMEPDKQ